MMTPDEREQVIPKDITFRIGPRDYGVECAHCPETATYMLGRPYDLSPGGEIATPACATHAADYPPWNPR